MTRLSLYILLLTSFTLSYGYDFHLNVTLPGMNDTRTFIVDTTFRQTLVMDAESFNNTLDEQSTFDPTQSRSFVNKTRPWSIWVGDTQGGRFMDGYIGQDVFKLGAKKAIKHEFIVIKRSKSLLPVTTIDGKTRIGRIGFHRASINVTSILFNWLQTYKTRNVCLHISESRTGHVKQTTVAVGVKIPEERLIFKYKDPLGQSRNFIPISNFTVNGYRVPLASTEALLDSASSKLTLGAESFDRLLIYLDARKNTTTKEYSVLCNKLKTFGFSLHNTHFDIPFKYLVHQERPNSRFCRLLIARGIVSTYLGVPFFINNGICQDHTNNDFYVYDAKYNPDDPIFADAKDYGGYVAVHEERT